MTIVGKTQLFAELQLMFDRMNVGEMERPEGCQLNFDMSVKMRLDID